MGTELVKVESFPITLTDPAGAMSVITENMGPHGFNLADLDRVNVPGAGGQAWEIPGVGSDAEIVKHFDAIIIHFRDARRLFTKPFEETGTTTAPDCFSDDGFMGVGTPGGECMKCPNAQFGTDPKGGRGQACRAMRLLFCMRPGSVVPLVLKLPATSLQPCRKYFMRLGSQNIPFWSVVTRIGLEKKKGTFDYSVATFNKVADMTKEQIVAVAKVRQSMLPALSIVKVDQEDFKPEPGSSES